MFFLWHFESSAPFDMHFTTTSNIVLYLSCISCHYNFPLQYLHLNANVCGTLHAIEKKNIYLNSFNFFHSLSHLNIPTASLLTFPLSILEATQPEPQKTIFIWFRLKFMVLSLTEATALRNKIMRMLPKGNLEMMLLTNNEYVWIIFVAYVKITLRLVNFTQNLQRVSLVVLSLYHAT